MTHRLEVRNLQKRFGGVVAVDDVSFTVDAGECLGLIGPNGAGKTTVFSMVAGEIESDGGSVVLDGKHIERLHSFQRARFGIARTYQRLEVFPEMTVLDHLIVAQSAHSGSTGVLRDLRGKGAASKEEIEAADVVLEQVGLTAHRNEFVGRLSLGTCRMVELARALVVEPSVLLADEPSSGLDDYETRAMADVLASVQQKRGLAIVLVEHDLAIVAALTSRVVVMDVGRVLAEGPFKETMANDRVRHAYLGDHE